MGNCKYCGKNAGLFSSVHQECEEKYRQARSELSIVFRNYFSGKEAVTDVSSIVRKKKIESFISNDDICSIVNEVISEYCDSLLRPYPASILRICSDFISATGVSYYSLNSQGAFDRLATKLMRGFIADYFTDILSLEKAMGRCQRIMSSFPISKELETDTYMEMLEKASSNFLKDGRLRADEQTRIDNFVTRVGIQISNLPAKYQDSDVAKVGQAVVLRNLENGVYPKHNMQLPVILSKNEHVLWVYYDVSMYLEKIEREMVGRTSGFSYRVCKGVTYRVGQFKGHPVEHSRMNLEGRGVLFVTNKNIIFYSTQKSNKIAFSKIVGITPYSDGIEVHKDGNAKRLTFTGFDSWFIMNLLSMVNNI